MTVRDACAAFPPFEGGGILRQTPDVPASHDGSPVIHPDLVHVDAVTISTHGQGPEDQLIIAKRSIQIADQGNNEQVGVKQVSKPSW